MAFIGTEDRMNSYRYAGNIKAGLFVFGIILIVGLIVYTQNLVNNLRDDNREIVKLYSELIASAVAQQSDENLDFIFENIIKKVQFPIIQSDSDNNPQSWRNLPDQVSEAEVRKILSTMDMQNEPIPLIYPDVQSNREITFGYLHYGDSKLIQQLKWLPYFEIGAVAVFIFLGFVGFSFIRSSEKRHIWVGMARETAHQLGTPVSALMGWVDWLKSHPEKAHEIVPEIETDLQRLQQVGERFSRMGSKPEITSMSLSQLVETIVEYFQRRLPSMGKNIVLSNRIDSDVMIKANGTLLSWAIENVIKNGIDSIVGDKGEIRIELRQTADRVTIQIRDNGRGIPAKDRKNIFRPGFSTKKHGWGLGLSLTRRIIHDIHRGTISVRESKIDYGTTFEITLPQ